MSKKDLYTGSSTCIHLGACRRYAAIVKDITGHLIRRGCNEKECSMYLSRGNLEEKINGYLDDRKSFIREQMTRQYIPDNEEVSYALNRTYIAIDDFLP